MTKKQWRTVSVGLLVALFIVLGFWYDRAKAPVPEQPIPESSRAASTTSPVATTSVSSVPKPVAVAKFPINQKDTIVSWSFTGAYTGNDALTAKANADIAYLTGLLGKGQYNDYDLYIGIGNDYDLMGDGARAYQNYNRAISLIPNKGLAYANQGHLMGELGAYYTAADAYAKAVAVEPISQYKNAQLDYLTWRFPEEAARLTAKQ